MKTIKYKGPHEAVEIAATGDLVKRGETVDVPDELAESLLEQDVWASATKAAPKKTVKES